MFPLSNPPDSPEKPRGFDPPRGSVEVENPKWEGGQGDYTLYTTYTSIDTLV